ncbi:MAG TPA: 2,3-bisphosphoglycerate-independent phosphoglycerate mutase [Clostridia bacterium]|nr:2,3-bisphosphoglycerate-independent phosphoglycerate mutase [Clostridia bacterium]HOL60787.1 2,3-bisphosphoglycerate-independent phosphoglycerate mutase [Clostridia bacterium]HPO53483.1 2,3-bisphosphoglycerate-independent phosphoglycerate mutase [Clostridia bacterium]
MFNALIILDGFAISDEVHGNAIKASGIPFISSLMAKYPYTTIGASGLDVGLPKGQMGNSEVGHINIGAGRIVYQELTRITKDIEDGEFFKNKCFLDAVQNAKKDGHALHVFGLLSDGGVHSHIEHLFALIELAKREGLSDVYIHCFMDGRDVPPTSGAHFLKQLQDYVDNAGIGTIASVMGRYYAMDRDNRWERVQKAYDALTMGEGEVARNAVEAATQSYAKGVTDEFILPTVICKDGKPVRRIQKGDSIIFFNFRPDRAREITRALIKEDFTGFERKSGFLAPHYVGFTQYDATFNEIHTAFLPQSLTNNLGQIFAQKGLKQLRIAETEKYAHVTFFFNSGVEAPNPGEDRVLIPSPKVATYDLKPEMSAYEVTDKAIELVKSGKYDVMILNYANCDMVGHTGVFDAAVKAVTAVDGCLKRLIEAIQSVGGQAIVTADHGNADKMMEADGSPFTAHTTNPVPFIVVKEGDFKLAEGGILADVAPTLLDMMGIEKPAEMEGKSLIVKS